jgi:hypothetical protein
VNGWLICAASCAIYEHDQRLTQRGWQYGETFADVNLPGTDLQVPLGVVTGRPPLAEPLGGVLTLLAGLFEDDVKALQIRSGLLSFKSLLSSQFLYTPHDIVVPGALTAGDLCDIAATLAPRPLFLYQLVDGLNQQATVSGVRGEYDMTVRAYQEQSAEKKLEIASRGGVATDADWLLKALKE